ncbi:MAG: hypothetical protein JO121_15950 [Deltaproteobacteria bacterium]|nr:hypothetical protein [Deltaproteobacteria bacterium]
MRSSGAEVLYATNRDGQEVKLAGTDAPLGDGSPLDLGRPSVGPDGTVLFGAAFRSGNQVRWQVFAASPDTHAVSRLPLFISPGEAPQLVTDPTPLAQADGSVVFAAEENSHREAVYRLKGGNLTCLLQTGSNLGQGRILRNLGFGTLGVGDGGAVALIGYLTASGKVELLVSNGGTRVLAAVGEKAPDGVRYRDLGPPSVSASHGFAFAALTDGGARVYESEEEKLRVALRAGSSCGEGKISYISQDRVGLNSDGSITVAGTCSGSPALFLISISRRTMLVGAGTERADSEFVDLAMPRLFNDGSIMFSASTRTGGDGLYSIRPESGTANPSGPALPLLSASTSPVEPLHSILVVSVASNEQGRLAYLGGPVVSFASVPPQ